MISWMTRDDDAKAFNNNCNKCENQQLNHPQLLKAPCPEHELEYANQEVKVINIDFLDPENPVVGEKYINSIIMSPDDDFTWLLDHIEADEYEKRTTVVSMTTKKMSRNELNTLPEWEP